MASNHLAKFQHCLKLLQLDSSRHSYGENMKVSLYYLKEAGLMNITDDHELSHHKIGESICVVYHGITLEVDTILAV